MDLKKLVAEENSYMRENTSIYLVDNMPTPHIGDPESGMPILISRKDRVCNYDRYLEIITLVKGKYKKARAHASLEGMKFKIGNPSKPQNKDN